MAKALILGDDTGACLGAVRSLGRSGIEVHAANCDRNPATIASRYLAAFHELPRYRDGGGAWLARMRALIAAHSFDLIAPTSDSSLMQLLRHTDQLEARLAVPNAEAARVFTDKWATRELARQRGVPVAPGALLADGPPQPSNFPVVLKHRRSYECGNRVQKSEVRLVNSPAELTLALGQESFELIETMVPGYCRGLSVLAREGKIWAAHQHRRLQQIHATGPSSCRISEECDPQLLDWARALVSATELTGVAMFEYRHDPHTGTDVLLEVNPRLWGSLPLALEAGADFPAWLYGMLVENREPPRRIGSRPGLVKRSLVGEVDRFAGALDRAAGPADWLRLGWQAAGSCVPLLRGRQFDSWAADDSLPFKVGRAELGQQVLSYLTKAATRLRRRFAPRRA